MRLIDADALKESVREKFRHSLTGAKSTDW